MEIRDIEEEEEGHRFVIAKSPCAGGEKIEDEHDYCEVCSYCGHPNCRCYSEKHHGKGLREEETQALVKEGKVTFEVIGREDFHLEHTGGLIRIFPEEGPVFHVALTHGKIQIYYCGVINNVDKS